MRGMINRLPILPNRDDIIWYSNNVSPLPLPDNYIIFDRNIVGPRAWYGRWNYAGTFRTMQATEAGHETLMGAMTVDDPDGRVNSILVDITPRVRIFAQDTKDSAGVVTETADARLTTNFKGNTVIGRNFNVSSAQYALTTVKNGAYKGTQAKWQARQLWLGLPDRIIGLLSTVPTEENAPSYEVTNVFRFISGGTAGALETKTMTAIDDRQYQYGELNIRAHQLMGFTKIEPVVMNYRLPKYPATELTMRESKGLSNTANTLLKYPLNSHLMSLVEVRPTWVTKNVTKAARLQRSDGILAFQVSIENKLFTIWYNPLSTAVNIGTALGKVAGVASSIRISSVNNGAPSTSIPTYPSLAAGHQMVIVSSPDPQDHLAGWGGFQDLVRLRP